MDWMQFAIFITGMFSCFFWNRSESRNDARHFDICLMENRNETNEMIREFRNETNAILRSIQEEIKDFHCRLYSLEERSKNMKK